MTRDTEIRHYEYSRSSVCHYDKPSPCALRYAAACDATDDLIEQLETGTAKDIAAAKETLADARRDLDRCRVKHGARLSLYGVHRWRKAR